MIVDPEAIRVAALLSNKLDEAIRSSPGAEPYVKALDHAKNFWSGLLQFQRTLDLFKPKGERTASFGERVYRAFSGDDPEILTEQGALAAIRVLRGSPTGLAEFRGALARDAMRNPGRIPTLLQNMDVVAGLPNGKEVFPASLRNQLEAFQARLANADVGQLEAQIKEFQSGAITAQRIISGGAENIEYVRTMLRQGIWTEDQLRGYIMYDLAEKSLETGKDRGARVLDPAKYQRELQRVKSAGLYDLLPARSRRLLDDVELLTSFLRDAGDIGSGMAAGTINQRRLQSPRLSPVFWYAVAKQKYVAFQAYLASTPAFIRAFGYGDRPPTDWRATRQTLRLATEAMARSNDRANISPAEASTEVQPQQQEQP